ncbi:outer membrane protein [Opitutaceae bacterium TAV1]|nr:outer membrane protein [Opitutaceae bacterium TAV1]
MTALLRPRAAATAAAFAIALLSPLRATSSDSKSPTASPAIPSGPVVAAAPVSASAAATPAASGTAPADAKEAPPTPPPSRPAPAPTPPKPPPATTSTPDEPITDPVIAAVALASPTPGGVPLTLEDCVSRALDANFNLRIQRFTTESTRENVPVAESAFSPNLSLSTAYGESRADATKANGNDTRLQVSKKLATGATAAVSGALDRSHTNTPPYPSGYNSVYGSDVAFSVSQPLLKGAGTTVNRAAIDRARLGSDIADLDFKSTVLDVVRDVEAAYYNLLYARGQLGVLQFSLDVAERLLRENTSRRDVGVGTDLEVLQAEVGVANARRAVLESEQTVRNREDALVALFGTRPGEIEVGALTLPDAAIPDVSIDRSYKLALDNYPDYTATLLSIRQLRLDVRVAANDKLPSLALGGAVGYNADDDSYSDAVGHTFNGDRYNWQVDVTVSFPWGMKAERARYRQSVLGLTREQTRLARIEQDLRVAVRAAVRAVDTNREAVRISSLATTLSERQYEFEKARYDSGLNTFRRVQESQEDLDTARVNELQSRVNLRVALSELARLEASSLSRYNIAVVEPASSRPQTTAQN